MKKLFATLAIFLLSLGCLANTQEKSLKKEIRKIHVLFVMQAAEARQRP